MTAWTAGEQEADMADEREQIGACECCGTTIRDGDPHFSYSDGPVLCEEHAPLKSEMVAELRDWASRDPFIEDESLNYPTAADVIARAEKLEAEISASGDCKVLTH